MNWGYYLFQKPAQDLYWLLIFLLHPNPIPLSSSSKSNTPTVANTETRGRFYLARRQEKEIAINHVLLLSISRRALTFPQEHRGWEEERNSSLICSNCCCTEGLARTDAGARDRISAYTSKKKRVSLIAIGLPQGLACSR